MSSTALEERDSPPPSTSSTRPRTFDVHAGRNAFRRQKSERASEMARDLETMDVDELRRQQFVIRSFTESVDDGADWPPAPPPLPFGAEDNLAIDEGEDGAGGDGGGMKESSTADTIIEMVNRSVDPTKGETQKYTMRVPGPELVDQEFELHKSLIKEGVAGDDNELELEGAAEFEAMAKGAGGRDGAAPQNGMAIDSAAAWSWPAVDEQEARQRRVSMRQPPPPAEVARPRPTTPTGLSFSRLESFGAENIQNIASTSTAAVGQVVGQQRQRMPPDSLPAKMRVVIPKSKLKNGQRRFSTGARDYADRGPKTRTRCGSTAVCPWGAADDIIESNPEYAFKAPPKPAIHRKQSRDCWESFDAEAAAEEASRESERTVEQQQLNNKTADEEALLTKAQLQKEVQQLIVEAEHKLQLEADQEAADFSREASADGSRTMSGQLDQSPPPTPTSTPVLLSSIPGPATSQSRKETSFESAAQFASSKYEQPHPTGADGEGTPLPVRAAPPPPAKPPREQQATATEHRQMPAAGDGVQLELFASAVETRVTATLQYPAEPNSANPFDGGGSWQGQESFASGPAPDWTEGRQQATTAEWTAADAYNGQPVYGGQQRPADYGGGVPYGQQSSYEPAGYAAVYDAPEYSGNVGYGGGEMGGGAYSQQQQQTDFAAYQPQTAVDPYSQYGTTEPTTIQQQQYDQYGQYGSADYGAGATTDQQYQQYGSASNPFGDPEYAAGAGDAMAYGTEYGTPATYGHQDYGQSYGQDYGQYGQQPAEPSFPSQSYQQTTAYSAPYQPEPYPGEAPYQVNTSMYAAPPPQPADLPPPLPPQFSLANPVLPAPIARTPDPFSWEAQESAISTHGTAVAPPRPAPAGPRTPEAPPAFEQKPKENEPGKVTAPAPARPGAPPSRPSAPSPSRPPAPPSPRPARKGAEEKEEPKAAEEEKKQKADSVEAEEDSAWARFQRMTDQVSQAVRTTEQRLGQLAGEQSAAGQLQDDQLVQSYLAHTGGAQGMQLTATQQQQLKQQESDRKKAKAEKKLKKLEKGLGGLGAALGGMVGTAKRAGSPPADPKRELDLEKAATELAKKIAAQHGFQLAGAEGEEEEQEEERKVAEKTEQKKEAEAMEAQKSAAAEGERIADQQKSAEPPAPPPLVEEPPPRNWAAFEDAALLPPSESDVQLAEKLRAGAADPFDTSRASAALEGQAEAADPFAPVSRAQEELDPFEVKPLEELMAEARQQAEMERARREVEREGGELLATDKMERLSVSRHSSPTPEGGSPVTPSMRPPGFDDDFRAAAGDDSETPLYDEDDSQPLPEFPLAFRGDGWELLLRYPPKKKLMTDRYWKPIYVRLQPNNMLALFANAQEARPSQEILLQASYSLSDTTLQAYDIYGKIHTVKLQHVLYKERVGIRPGQISRLVEGHITKYGLPLEHAAQCTVLAKFGSLDAKAMASFTQAVEDVLFRCPAKRESAPVYRQDEVQIHCYDEYEAHVDREGYVHDQRARVRLFCLSFLSGSPFLEIGLNDRRREGKEVVRRKDILPMYTERWIRFEAPEFHETVDPRVWAEDQVVRLQPPDGCFFEIMRFRVRPPRQREKPLSVKCMMRMAGSRVEIRIDAMAAVHQQRAKGTVDSTRAIPCEDIAIRFPLPEAWIYIFREERHWGVGSVHSKQRKPGRVKNLRDKLMGTVQQNEQSLIEVGIGEAKYEHLYRSLVWRIPQLPEKQSAAYKSYPLKCRFELSSFDLMPETFVPRCDLEFTMPLAVISNTVIRSVGVEQHEDSDRVEKFVRYVAKCHYSIDIDYVQCADLDEIVPEPAAEEVPEAPKHVPAFNPAEVQNQHEGYRIELPDDVPRQRQATRDATNGEGSQQAAGRQQSSSSSDDDDARPSFPVIQIDMKGYGY